MLIFCHNITPRFTYITRFILGEITDIPFTITNKLQEYKNFDGAKINYSNEQTGSDEIWIRPSDLLSQSTITEQSIKCTNNKNYKTFFNTGGDMGFDLFAATFYLITRYEEYLPHNKDSYGRYAHENSLAFRENFLQLPLVNIWIMHFRLLIRQRFPQLLLRNPLFVFLPTYDIDMAWSYKNKGLFRNLGGMLKDLVNGNLKQLNERIAVLTNKKEDPFASYNWLNDFHEKHDLNPIYFFLIAKAYGIYDKNIDPELPAMQQLIKQHAEKYLVGIHPSWQSGESVDGIINEKERMEEIINQNVVYSRQHYIGFQFPQTAQRLINAGIKHDFSMGYGSINGFRASVASVYPWYDLENEKQTGLMIHPFCFMDANAFYEQRISSSEALKELRFFTTQLQQTGGTMITIWHNNFLGSSPGFKDWKNIYQQWVTENVAAKPAVTL